LHSELESLVALGLWTPIGLHIDEYPVGGMIVPRNPLDAVTHGSRIAIANARIDGFAIHVPVSSCRGWD